MKKIFEKETLSLKNKSYVDQKILQQFIKRINSDRALTKEGSPSDHFCSFFVPVHLKSGSVYLGHHIKADDWIPPGGHIEHNETPIDTVRREFPEELEHNLSLEKIELFDLTVKKINNPRINCQTHYDFWYLVYFDNMLPFNFLKKEFYQASWFPINQAIKKIKQQNYARVIKKLIDQVL